jgi:hypothetical protein
MSSTIVLGAPRAKEKDEETGERGERGPRGRALRTVKLQHQPAKAANADGSERVGRVLRERWRIEQLIWKTSGGALYWATHRTGTRVAIHVLFPELSADPERKRRFIEAAAGARAIGHDGAVRVIDDDVDSDGAVFLVLELFDATSLAWMFDAAHGPFELAEALRIGDGLLEVLAAAHAAGRKHGALSAESVFLTRQGQVKLLGFSDDPEANVRHDTAAAGRILFTMLAGTPPNGRSLAEQATTLPSALVEIVDRALGVGGAKPWRDAGEMHAALRDVSRDGEQVETSKAIVVGTTTAPLVVAPRPRVPSVAPIFAMGEMNPLFLGPICEPRHAEVAVALPAIPKRSTKGFYLAVAAILALLAILAVNFVSHV